MWYRQLPFLTLLVFGIGVGLGVAWKTGFIPVELTSADTGTLCIADPLDSDIESASGTSVTLSPPPADSAPADPAIFATQTEPSDSDAGPVLSSVHPVTRNQLRPVQQPTDRSDATDQRSDPEWAKPASTQPADNRPLDPAKGRSAAMTPAREIRLASHQEPSNSAFDSAPREAGASPFVEDLKAIDEQIANEEFLPAHRSLSKLYWKNKEARDDLLPRLNQTARAIFFEPRPHLVEPYVVQANDQMRVIATKYQLSWEYLAKLNRTEPRRLQPGQKLKVLKGPFAAVVDLNEFALTIHLQGYFVKRYEVGIGKDGASPLGKFPVLNKVENPQYTGPDGKVIGADDPANPLGERWIDLGDSYGIHGTIEPESIGRAASRGCIRMRTKDVIEVYDFLVKGSEVVIRK